MITVTLKRAAVESQMSAAAEGLINHILQNKAEGKLCAAAVQKLSNLMPAFFFCCH